jgi:hypothetical protein
MPLQVSCHRNVFSVELFSIECVLQNVQRLALTPHAAVVPGQQLQERPKHWSAHQPLPPAVGPGVAACGRAPGQGGEIHNAEPRAEDETAALQLLHENLGGGARQHLVRPFPAQYHRRQPPVSAVFSSV